MKGVEVKILQAEENAMADMMRDTMKHVLAEIRPEFFLQEEVLTVVEAAAFCKMSRSSFESLVRQGRIKPHRPTGKPVYLKSELTDFIKKS